MHESAHSEDVRERHARYFTDLAGRLGLSMEGMAAGHGQRYDLANPELDNFRAALDWAEAADPVLGITLAVALENFWVVQGLVEGAARLETLLARTDGAPLSLRAAGVRTIGSSAVIAAGDPAVMERPYAESLALYERAGDEWGVAVLEHRLGVTSLGRGDWSRARRLLERSLERARRHGFAIVEGQALGSLAEIERHEGNPEKALELTLESVRIAREIGFSWWEMGMLGLAAELAAELRRDEQAASYTGRALAIAHRIGDRLRVVWTLAEIASSAAGQGDAERAGRLWAVVEREEARAPLPLWERHRHDYAGAVEALAGDEFERGRAAGRLLALDEAVAEAIAGA